MKIYRFVGSEASLAGGAIKCERLGQVVQLEEAPDPRTPVISEAQFKSCGFTQEELDQFAHHTAREAAPPDFVAKLRKAWAMIGQPEAPATTKKKGED